MSSSCRRLISAPRRGACMAYSVVLTLAASGAADAYEYFQPEARVSVSLDSNAALIPNGSGKTASENYDGNVGGTWNVLTPQFVTVLRPQVGYEDNPKIRERSLIGQVDLYSQYRFERGEFDLQGQFNYSNTYTSELAAAAFNP